MSAGELGLLQSILESPRDDVHRLVYADWLEDAGQPDRAEFIRVQIQLARSPHCGHRSSEEDCERCRWTQREESLLSQHGGEWVASLPGGAWRCESRTSWRLPEEWAKSANVAGFERGFVSFVLIQPGAFAVADKLVDAHPIERIQLAGRWPAGEPGAYRWAVGEADEGPELLPLYLSGFGHEDFPERQSWTTQEDALLALSRACLECARSTANRHFAGRRVFTTGQVATICQVSSRTVTKWFDSGKLRGYRIPGSQDRRIPGEQLIRFMRENGIWPPRPPRPQPAKPSAEELAEREQSFRDELAGKDALTIEEAARLCKVTPRVVRRWVKLGALSGERDEGRTLIRRRALARFLRETLGFVEEGQQAASR